MVLMLEAMLALAGFILLCTAPWVYSWINETIKENPLLRKVLHVIGALIILIPAVSIGLSQLQQRSASVSPEVVQQLAAGIAILWGFICFIVPAVLLSCGAWDRSNKELFRFTVGLCLWVNVALLIWTLVNEISRIVKHAEAVIMVGPIRWAIPIGFIALLVFDYFILKLSNRVYPPELELVAPDIAVLPVAPPQQEPAQTPIPAKTRRTRSSRKPAQGEVTDGGS